MHKNLLVFLIIFCLNVFSCNSYADYANRLILIRGTMLNAYYNDTYKTIKWAETIYGFGWISKSKVFVAYQDPKFTEAVAILEVIDLGENITTKLNSIGGVGESNFDINPDTGYVAYNDSDGVHVLVLNENYSLSTHDVFKSENTSGVFWLDTKTIGMTIFNKDNVIFKKIEITQYIDN